MDTRPFPPQSEPATRTPLTRRHGPGVLEALVALSLLVSLAGVVMPTVGEEVANSRIVDAQAQMQDVARGLAAYMNDTLFLPTGREGRTNVAWLYGPGELPAGNAFTSGGEGRAIEDFLVSSSMGGGSWKGPYVADLQPDPWGNALIVNVDGWLDASEQVFVISAGPNGEIETAPNDNVQRGDDLILLLD